MTVRILLIDDDLLLGQLIRALVAGRGGEVIQVQNGKTGIEMAQAGVFDHILVDLMLPQIDGLNVLRVLCKQPHQGVRPKLTAISSRRQAEQKQDCIAAGADQFLEKPVRPQVLFDCLAL
jgi:DNA-binding response OmpR family regulator